MTMEPTTRIHPLAIWLLWGVAMAVLLLGPASLPELLRQSLHDGIAPTLIRLGHLFPGTESVATDGNSDSVVSGMNRSELERENEVLRSLLARSREVRERDSIARNEPSDHRLLEVDVVAAQVLGVTSQGTREDRRGVLIHAGTQAGFNPRDLVLTGQGILVDAGRDLGLAPDQLVTAGRVLFGRTQTVGRWTSWVMPITDPEFRIAARVVRMTELGPVAGPRGVLRGNGQRCHLDEIPATEALGPGDFVETDASIIGTAFPIGCGRIVLAELPESASHWRVIVEPACTPRRLPDELQVVRTRISSGRLSVGAVSESSTGR